jgi:hypothetical protein
VCEGAGVEVADGQRQDATSYLLKLDLTARLLTVKDYSRNQSGAAQEDYAAAEKSVVSAGDVVLVAAGSANALKKAYPNYFADTTRFLRTLGRVIGKLT